MFQEACLCVGVRAKPAVQARHTHHPSTQLAAAISSPSRPAHFGPALQDQYLEITTAIQGSSRFFGLGERIPSQGMELLKNGIPLALWTRDQPAADPDQNNYGAHPNFIEIRPGGLRGRSRL